MSSANQKVNLSISGHVEIKDSVDGVILDQHNAVHPQNLSRIFARALANEQNHSIFKIAFGNGGTYIDATGQVSFRTPNDGLAPDTRAWQSRLYNETYYEIIDEASTKFGTGPGAFPSGDGSNAGVRSNPAGVASQVVITAVLNASEPNSQAVVSLDPSSISTDFVFDELGLFSPGLPPSATQGYQDVNIGSKIYTDLTYLTADEDYNLYISIDGQPEQTVVVHWDAESDTTYEDLVQAINDQLIGATAQISRPGVNTYGKLRIVSNTAGATSSILMRAPTIGTTEYNNWLFSNLKNSLNNPVYLSIDPAIQGLDGGVEEKPEDQSQEQERMLTHLVFHPLLKSADRVWTITYTLTIEIERSSE